MDDTYLSFLRLLDNSQFLAHLRNLSQDSEGPIQASRAPSLLTSTPNRVNVVRSFDSDPFDDSLDNVLLNLKKEPSVSLDLAVPGNQLALEDTDSDPDEVTFGEVGTLHGFGDYGTYFHNKHLKQQKADEEYVKWDQERRKFQGVTTQASTIFAGCVVFVNGNTVPSLAKVHKLVVLHGGKFLNYLNNKGAATHIICDRLTPRKRMQFRNYRVVRAKWIADCVEQNKLLDWRDYRLIEVVDFDQGRLGFKGVENDDNEVPDEALGDLDSLDELEGQAFEEDLEDLKEEVLEVDELNDELDEDILNQELKDNLNEPMEEDDLLLEIPVVNVPDLRLNHSRERTHTVAMDAKHPDFLKHFFANSRLHHLSTWKADLRSKFLRLVAKQAVNNPVRPSTLSKRVILHIDFDCFFATASALSHPQLDINRDPIAVSHGGDSSDVASCNYVARKKGVSNGMWLGRAKKMCPELKVIDYNFSTYETHSNSFYNYLITRNIFDSIFPVLIDEVLVDATSHCLSEPDLAKSVNSLCQEIREDIFGLTQCSVSIGAADNVLLAKLSIRKAKPNGHFYLQGDCQEFLNKVKVQDLPGIGRSIRERLANELQMSSPKAVLIEDVKPLSAARLAKIFGEKTGLKLYEYCRGIDHTKIVLDLSSSEALLGRKTVSVDVNFGIRFDTFAQAEDFLMNLSKELHARMIDLGVCGSAISLRLARRAPGAPKNPPKYLGMGRCDFSSKSSRMGVPTNDWGIIGSELKALFRILNIPVEELRGVAVSMSKLEDVEVVKRQRQQRLEFNQARAPRKIKEEEELIEFGDPVVNSESIDWEIFNQLPPDIRTELKQELLRRGIPVSGKEQRPRDGGPVKKEVHGKVYFQQTFPTQENGPFKLARVIESPSKKKRKLNASPIKSLLPVKRAPSPSPNNQSVSYDENVLNEIPSSIRNEFMRELEWQKKNKKLVFVSMKEKMEQQKEDKKVIVESEITPQWLAAQPRLVRYGDFGNLNSDYSEVCELVKQWVLLSLELEGPHHDDVHFFAKYLMSLAVQGNLNRSLNLLKIIDQEIHTQSSVLSLCDISPDKKNIYSTSIKDWEQHLKGTLKTTLVGFCRERNIEVQF